MSKGAATRHIILDHAAGLASQVGLTGLTIGALADDLQLSKSGLFAHFHSKEALQIQVLEHAAAGFVEQVVRPALQKPRGDPRMRALFEREWQDIAAGLFPAPRARGPEPAEFLRRRKTLRETTTLRYSAMRCGNVASVEIQTSLANRSISIANPQRSWESCLPTLISRIPPNELIVRVTCNCGCRRVSIRKMQIHTTSSVSAACNRAQLPQMRKKKSPLCTPRSLRITVAGLAKARLVRR